MLKLKIKKKTIHKTMLELKIRKEFNKIVTDCFTWSFCDWNG